MPKDRSCAEAVFGKLSSLGIDHVLRQYLVNCLAQG